MGGGSSKVDPGVTTGAQKQLNKSIEDRIVNQRAAEKEAVKVLLLGAGECGKSTILKQMKILHLDGFGPEEKALAKALVFKNTVDAIQSLIEACTDLGIPYDDPSVEAKAKKITEQDTSGDIPLSLAGDIDAVWKDGGTKKALKRENEFHLLDSASYFLNKVIEYFTPDFEPSTQDILRTRLTTTGIIETAFKLEETSFKMYDVGGQRGERKKWIHVFDDVTAIMFIASLSEYDQVLAEDRSRNRLIESLDLFEGIINLPWFQKASVILFLNKNDLFEEKIKRVHIGDYHPDYSSDKRYDYDEGLNYIQQEYFDRNEDENKTLYCHVTDATNTENVAFVWKATKHIILEGKLTSSGLQMC